MPEVNEEWVKAQFTQAKIRQNTGDAVLRLLEAWAEISDLDELGQDNAINTFGKLARGHALVAETQERWVPTQIGAQINVGDTIRVRADAFSAAAGQKHNGRVGKVVAKRAGDIIVDSTDGVEPKLIGVHYPANKLEIRLK
jgi:hypothetical protein